MRIDENTPGLKLKKSEKIIKNFGQKNVKIKTEKFSGKNRKKNSGKNGFFFLKEKKQKKNKPRVFSSIRMPFLVI